MAREFLLGIDVGTSACKVAAFTPDGAVKAQASRAYQVYHPEAGWAEQEPGEWWEAICEAIGQVLRLVKPSDICGIGVDGQSWSAVPISREGHVMARTPIWMDTRAKDICARMEAELGEEIFQCSGNPFQPSYTTPKLLWFKRERPELFRYADKFLQSNSYVVWMLTGVMSQDLSQSYGLHFFDVNKLRYDAGLAERLGLSTDLVPDLCPCDQVVGRVTEAAARATGLTAGTPVVAGGLDAACGTLGAGVYKPGQTQEQGGQAGGMSICTGRALAHRKLILSPHVVPGQWLLQGGTVGGGGVLRWYRQQFGGEASFGELTREAEDIPPGADGVTFLPYMAGERSPIWDPDAKGVLYGLGFDKTRAHVVRALLEGVAYSLEHNLRVAAETGIEVDRLSATGGSANSALWTQIKADVTGKTIQVPASDTASTLGAALLAGVGCGVYRGYDEAVARTIRITKVYEPDPARHELYQKRMELYLRLYEALKDTFAADCAKV